MRKILLADLESNLKNLQRVQAGVPSHEDLGGFIERETMLVCNRSSRFEASNTLEPNFQGISFWKLKPSL